MAPYAGVVTAHMACLPPSSSEPFLFWSSLNCHGDCGGSSEIAMQIYYKDIIVVLLVTFWSTWLTNLVEAGFCLSQLQEIGEGEAGEQVVSKNLIQRCSRQDGNWGGVELEAFVPCFDLPASVQLQLAPPTLLHTCSP